MAEKQPHLNGAYYGPAVPPKKNSYHRPGRGGGCVCGCGCCLLKLIFNLVLTVVVAVGLLALIFWLIFRPNLVKFHVTDAELTQFNFTATNTLSYDLKLNLTIRNPNRRIGIYYDSIEVRALYEGQRVASNYLTPFYQGHKNTTTLSTAFQGQQVVQLSTSEQSDFNSEQTAGVYDIDMKLYLRVRFKLGKIKTFRIKPRVKCGLKVPLSSSGSAATTTFQTEKCDIDWRIFR
ncbi:NDR1/HIN1-like protein 3 [Eucalyptus grandis]|uniref:Late embryogenesis abundant protein LEA-2 subgroup domain-containing protein n=1 Tax=Eucalyptus globulus TaxID=34317 RepID=A0ABD3IM08_EUCGL|nr:NDR1/HIN1-like protein 3 [Eucalyptus grandis]